MNTAEFVSRDANTSAIKKVLEDDGPLKCAVAFWGEKAWALLQDLKKDVQIICNLSSGGTNPRLIRRLLQKENFIIRTNERLHAKVFLGLNAAVVGSANVSANGLDESEDLLNGWIEAGIFIRDFEILDEIDAWFDSEWHDAVPVTDELLREAETHWNKRPGRKLHTHVPQRPNGWVQNEIYEALGNILKRIVVNGTAVKWHSGWDTYSIRLPEPNINGIGEIGFPITGGDDGKPLVGKLSLIFGDTMLQAKAFYSKKLSFDVFEKAKGLGWDVHGSFHLGCMQPGFVWMDTPDKKLKSYFAFWQNNLALLSVYKRTQVRSVLSHLEQEGIIRLTPEVEEEFEAAVTNTKRNEITLRPGFALRWSIREPELWQALDSSGRKALQAKVANKIKEIYDLVGLQASFLK